MRVALTFALLLLVAAPVAAKEPVATDLYFHINGFQDFPINTQAPDDRFRSSSSVGQLTWTNDCLGVLAGATDQPLLMSRWHTYYGYVSPSYVVYDKLVNGLPEIHQERGISYDVELAGDGLLRWYLETQVVSGDGTVADLNQAPVVLPNVMVQATLRTGDAVSVGKEAFDEGTPIAQGRAGPFLLAGPLNGTIPQPSPAEGRLAHFQVNGRHIYEFQVPLQVVASPPVVPQKDGANVRIDVYVQNDACGDPAASALMPNHVRVHTSPEHRPRMTLPVANPVLVTSVHPQFVAGDLVVHAAVNSPWGSYDVDEGLGGILLEIDGPTEPRTLERIPIPLEGIYGHGDHEKDLPVTYVWDFQADGAEEGLYTVTVRARNDQGTAWAERSAQFAVGAADCQEGVSCQAVRPPSRDASGAALALVLAALAAVAVLRRR